MSRSWDVKIGTFELSGYSATYIDDVKVVACVFYPFVDMGLLEFCFSTSGG